MSFPSPPKSYLDRIGKDATILGLFVILLFTEVAHQIYFSKSLITEDSKLSVLLSFPLIFSFVVFVLLMKLIFWLLHGILVTTFTGSILEVGIDLSYKVAFGSFLTGILLITHGITTDSSNMIAGYVGLDKYTAFCYSVGAFSLFLLVLWDPIKDSNTSDSDK